jgi:hypothetical protein
MAHPATADRFTSTPNKQLTVTTHQCQCTESIQTPHPQQQHPDPRPRTTPPRPAEHPHPMTYLSRHQSTHYHQHHPRPLHAAVITPRNARIGRRVWRCEWSCCPSPAAQTKTMGGGTAMCKRRPPERVLEISGSQTGLVLGDDRAAFHARVRRWFAIVAEVIDCIAKGLCGVLALGQMLVEGAVDEGGVDVADRPKSGNQLHDRLTGRAANSRITCL